MSQTMKGPGASEKENALRSTRMHRPGQRQQERMQRIARRQKRNRIIASSFAAFLVIAGGIAATLWFQNWNDQRIATSNAHATSTANAITNATATAVTKNCFISPNAPAIPTIYTSSATPTAGPKSSPAISGKSVALKDGLQYIDIKVGNGAPVQANSSISVQYTGWLASTCHEFDSSYDRGGQAFPTQLGQGQVIKGWDEGLVGMKVGGIRRLLIPAALGYGSTGSQADQNGVQAIPPNALLVFDVQMVSVK